MTSIVTTALVAYFVLANVTSADPSSQVSLTVSAEETAPKVQEVYSVSVTGYNAVPEQTDSDPFTTASGAYSNPDIVVARSVDLAEKLPFGTVVEFVVPENTKAPCGLSSVGHQIGLRVVADSMHSRKRNQMDILFSNEKNISLGEKKENPAVVLGVCKDIEVRVVGKIDIKKMPQTQTELATLMGTAALAANR